MGKHRFRLSDMMPNAWFYKLKDMNNNPRKNHHPPLPNKTQTLLLPPPPPPPPIIPKRASYYFPSNSPVHPKAVDTTHFPSPDSTPLSSTRRRRPPRRRKLVPTTTHHLATTSPARLLLSSSSTTSSSTSACRASSSDETDVHSYCIRNTTTTTAPPPPELDIVLDLHLRPILTKPPPAPPKPKNQPINLKPTPKSAAATSAAIQPRLRSTTSPNRKVRVAPRRPPARRRGIGESFAVVKSSSDPRRDFRESMVEMILENKLTASKDLEDLLACYLSLNSSEYHDVIVKVFEEIWLDITNFVRN